MIHSNFGSIARLESGDAAIAISMLICGTMIFPSLSFHVLSRTADQCQIIRSPDQVCILGRQPKENFWAPASHPHVIQLLHLFHVVCSNVHIDLLRPSEA